MKYGTFTQVHITNQDMQDVLGLLNEISNPEKFHSYKILSKLIENNAQQ